MEGERRGEKRRWGIRWRKRRQLLFMIMWWSSRGLLLEKPEARFSSFSETVPGAVRVFFAFFKKIFYLNNCFCVQLLEFLEPFVQFFKSGFVSVLCISPPEFSLPHACVSSSVILCCVVTPDFSSTFLESFLYFKLEYLELLFFSPHNFLDPTLHLCIFSQFLLFFFPFIFLGSMVFFLDFIIKKSFCSPSIGE